MTAIPIPGRWKPDVPLMLPKAGVFAHEHARVVAHRIAAEISGTTAQQDFCGDGYCMLEAGEDLAGFAFGNFFAEHVGKVLFEQWWLTPSGLRRRALELALKSGARAFGVRLSL